MEWTGSGPGTLVSAPFGAMSRTARARVLWCRFADDGPPVGVVTAARWGASISPQAMPVAGTPQVLTARFWLGSAVQVGVFVVVPVMRGVPMPVVKVIQVVLVRDRAMAATVAVDMVVFGRVMRPVPLGV